MSVREYRGDLALKILAGLVSNPSVIQPNDRNGWALVNSTEEQLATYACRLANALMSANEKVPVGSQSSGGENE